MNLPWLRHRTAARLDTEQQRRREALPAAPALDERPLASQRFVVVDLETTGLNMRRDVVLSIGAVVIEHGAIDLGQQFECTLNRPIQDMGVSVLIHGIAPSALARGIEPAEALLAFMEFVGDSRCWPSMPSSTGTCCGARCAIRSATACAIPSSTSPNSPPCSARTASQPREGSTTGPNASPCRSTSATMPAPMRWPRHNWR